MEGGGGSYSNPSDHRRPLRQYSDHIRRDGLSGRTIIVHLELNFCHWVTTAASLVRVETFRRPDGPVEFDDESGEEAGEALMAGGSYSDAVVHATDWTTETIVAQLRRGNISLNPRFQRRDAWSVQQKSRFIESLIMGLPVPQIVLAETRNRRGNYLVLDGKQRLLSILQYWGYGEGRKNRYPLSGLKVLTSLNRKRLTDLETDSVLAGEYDALLNQTVRTVVIRNWPDSDFLHLVFLRLNTGSTKLSPQELRQALQPGLFADWVDEVAAKSLPLQNLLGLSEADYRMRDTEVLARFIAFDRFLEQYPGRLKRFLDETFEQMNTTWGEAAELGATDHTAADQQSIVDSFEGAVSTLLEVFGPNEVARRPGSRLLNRTLLDMLLYYSKGPEIARAMLANRPLVKEKYAALFDSAEFVESIDSDTANTQKTVFRFNAWSQALTVALDVAAPTLRVIKRDDISRIVVD